MVVQIVVVRQVVVSVVGKIVFLQESVAQGLFVIMVQGGLVFMVGNLVHVEKMRRIVGLVQSFLTMPQHILCIHHGSILFV
jgi:hypothetical protein